jgi:peptidoglycan/xylan/chitin deacetylase (PgdA/CDA1 family)
MLTFRNTNIFFAILALVLISLQVGKVQIPFYYYLLLLFVYSGVLFYGSYYVLSQFYFPVIGKSDTQEKEIAISFDDGPLPQYTNDVLAVLEKTNTPATFFCIGHRVAKYPELMQKIHAAGHVIGNHSYSHSPVFDLYGAKKMTDDLQQMNADVRQQLGITLKLFRPPYGVTNPNLGTAVKAGGFTAVGWSIRSMDTITKDPDRLLKKVLKSLHPGAVVLFHDTCASTASMLEEFINEARRRGYRIVPLDKMLNLKAYA